MRSVSRILIVVAIIVLVASVPVAAYAADASGSKLPISGAEFTSVALGLIALIGSAVSLRRASRPRRSSSAG